MSIQSTIGNITKSASESAKSILNKAQNAINGIVGSTGTTMSTVWAGGFAGIDENNIDSLKSAITSYCDNINAIINGFNEEANLEVAYKGKVQTEAQDFLKAMKELLVAYVSLMRQCLKDLDEAVENYRSTSSELASQVASDAQEIRQNAQNIKLD